jgi:hypothetical protein
MPEIREALGIAEALAFTGCPYLVSFIVRPSGRLPIGELLPATSPRWPEA